MMMNYGTLDKERIESAWNEIPKTEEKRYVDYDDIAKEIEARITLIHNICQGKPIPMTWMLEDYLVSIGKLSSRLPTWMQIDQDCVAVSTAGAIQKLSVKEVTLLQNEEMIWTPHPTWLYALSRNQIGGCELGRLPGSLMAWMGQAINDYGILFMEEKGVPAYTKEVIEDWCFGFMRDKNYFPYFKFYDVAQKRNLTLVRCKKAEQVVNILKAGGTVTIVSDVGLQPYEQSNRRRYKFGGRAMYHQMYFSDVLFDDECTKTGVSLFRYNLWGTPKELQGLSGDPSGGAWYPLEYLEEELDRSYPEATGLLGMQGKETKPNYRLAEFLERNEFDAKNQLV
jgi:hypothetical protein